MDKKNPLTKQARLEQLIDEVRKAKLRVTEPRIAILQSLLDKHGPFTAEEIHQKITKKACDLATIYRSLTSLEKTGLIKRCEFGDGATRYELSESQHHHHHHVVCKLCKNIEVLDDCELVEIDRLALKRGFKEISHSLEFFGICPKCQERR